MNFKDVASVLSAEFCKRMQKTIFRQGLALPTPQ